MQLKKEKHESHDFTLVKVCMCNVYFISIFLYLFIYIYIEREGGQKKNAHKVLTVVNFWKVFFFSCDIYLFFLFILFENR